MRTAIKAPLGRRAFAAIAVAGIAAGAALAQTGAPVTPKLAPNVKLQAAYEAPPTTPLYVGNPTDIHTDITPYAPVVAPLNTVGERINPIAKVKDWDWYLVGRDGVGIGYVAGNMLSTTPISKS
jgi:hypothetical protein